VYEVDIRVALASLCGLYASCRVESCRVVSCRVYPALLHSSTWGTGTRAPAGQWAGSRAHGTVVVCSTQSNVTFIGEPQWPWCMLAAFLVHSGLTPSCRTQAMAPEHLLASCHNAECNTLW